MSADKRERGIEERSLKINIPGLGSAEYRSPYEAAAVAQAASGTGDPVATLRQAPVQRVLDRVLPRRVTTERGGGDAA